MGRKEGYYSASPATYAVASGKIACKTGTGDRKEAGPFQSGGLQSVYLKVGTLYQLLAPFNPPIFSH